MSDFRSTIVKNGSRAFIVSFRHGGGVYRVALTHSAYPEGKDLTEI